MPGILDRMIGISWRWVLSAFGLLMLGAVVLSGPLLGLPSRSLGEWWRLWEELYFQLAILLVLPVSTLVLVLLALLTKGVGSDHGSSGDLDRLLRLKRRGLLLRRLVWTGTNKTTINPHSEPTSPQVETGDAQAEEQESLLDRLVRRKRQGALSPYPPGAIVELPDSWSFWE